MQTFVSTDFLRFVRCSSVFYTAGCLKEVGVCHVVAIVGNEYNLYMLIYINPSHCHYCSMTLPSVCRSRENSLNHTTASADPAPLVLHCSAHQNIKQLNGVFSTPPGVWNNAKATCMPVIRLTYEKLSDCLPVCTRNLGLESIAFSLDVCEASAT